jgi:hypothetical protein
LAARAAAKTGYPVMRDMAIQVAFIPDILMHRTEQVGSSINTSDGFGRSQVQILGVTPVCTHFFLVTLGKCQDIKSVYGHFHISLNELFITI